MTLEDFAEVTRRVIARDGLPHLMPTAIFPARRHLITLEGFASNLPPDDRVMKWASSSAQGNEEFLVSFRVDARHFKVIRRVGPFSEDEVFAVE